jgi:hypothetical protein
MAVAGGPTDVHPAWTPGRYGVSKSSHVIDGEPSAISIRHHIYPFKRELPASGQSFDEQALRKAALDYLMALRDLVALPEEWLKALGPDATKDTPFGWMPIGWPPEPGSEGDDNAADPFVSFRIERNTIDGEKLDQTVMLLAAERLNGKFIGSGFGISIVVNLRLLDAGNFEAQIVGLSASLPWGRYKLGLFSEADLAGSGARQQALLASLRSDEVKLEIGSAVGLSSVAVRSARLSKIEREGQWLVERSGTGQGHSSTGQAIAYSFVLVGTTNKAGKLISKTRLQADAVADAYVFPTDSASQGTNAGYRGRRPSRSDRELDHYRVRVQLPSSPDPLKLVDAYGHELMRVIVCPGFVPDDTGVASGSAKSVNLGAGAPPVHSNDFSAISAFYNVGQMFDRLAAYGLDPFYYFRFADLPLYVAYRSGMQTGPGKDGQTINACVKVEGWAFDFVGPTKIGERPTMEMRLALADRTRRGRRPWDRVKPSVAEPLGIAADDRWAWHEFGHVLLVAGVGELEFRFAHSAGDALAAIALDPDSHLLEADHENISYWRGMTFPWVFIPRRHDRCVTSGWSWGGTMHRALASVPDSISPRRKGYLSEQILSSSLFRLYRALGGDTFDNYEEDKIRRHAASHYSLFLIMGAIQRLGFGLAVQLHNDPEQFVDALLDTESATQRWEVTFPLDGGETFERIGGCAYKVIRWAFEAQGLYAPPGVVTNAPGLPPKVDVYIANGRSFETTQNGTIEYGPGNYAPVSLHWDIGQSGGDPVPAWQADPYAIRVEADGIYVVVGNRGAEDALDVHVSVWWIEWPAITTPTTWNSGGWSQSPPVAARDIPAWTANEQFGPFEFAAPAPGRYIVVAVATCVDDLANLNVASFACSYMETGLVDLVAGDNNVGLRVVVLP